MTVAVVIPCYKVSKYIESLMSQIPMYVDFIICVIDGCPEKTLDLLYMSKDSRLHILVNDKNEGVGASVKRGYIYALNLNANIVVKIDGDLQMNPLYIEKLIRPIRNEECDYTKGNRFYSIDVIRKMPILRLIGNSGLSIITKFSSGYWNIKDPTNGYTAIHSNSIKKLCLDSINNRFFFESDMLYNLYMIRAVVVDVPIPAIYNYEKSNLRIPFEFFNFSVNNIKNFFKRIFIYYFLFQFSIYSIYIMLGFFLFVSSILLGSFMLYKGYTTSEYASGGSLVILNLIIIFSFLLILQFFNHDMKNIPAKPLCKD
jgi:dolichol-phosphate mannosyltransferase